MLWLGKQRTADQQRQRMAAVQSNQVGRHVSEAQWDALRKENEAFERTRPPFSEACFPCGASRGWEAAADENGRFWVCAGCHRRKLTVQQWHAELDQRKAEQEALASADAAAATPAATRAALIAAVERHRVREVAVVRLRAGVAKAEEMVLEASYACNAAAAALKAAGAADTDAIIAEATGERLQRRQTTREAREELEDAQEHRDRLRAALASLQAQLKEAEDTLALAASQVRRMAINAVRAHSQQWLARFVVDTAKMQAEYAARRRAVVWLQRQDLWPDDPASKAIVLRFGSAPAEWRDAPPAADPTAVWDALLAKLCADGNANAVLS